jgi:hypothetical protein
VATATWLVCVVVLTGAPARAAVYAPPAGRTFHGGTGGYTERSIRTFAHRSGRRPAVYQYFFTPDWRHPSRRSLGWQAGLLRRTARQRARAILHLSTARGGHGHSVISPAGIARGGGDRYLVALGRLIARSRTVTYVRLMAEMNNFNNPYCAVNAAGVSRGSDHRPAAYRQAWRRVALILRGGRVRRIDRTLRRLGLPRVRTHRRTLPRPRVALMWNPFTAGLPDVALNDPGAYWPGRRWVDWVGTDLFANSPNFAGMDRFYADPRWRGKPFMLGEWALWGREDPAFVSALTGWVHAHRRVGMEVYNQGGADVAYLSLHSFPVSAHVLRLKMRSRRFAAVPPEFRGRRPGRVPAHEPPPPPNEVPVLPTEAPQPPPTLLPAPLLELLHL